MLLSMIAAIRNRGSFLGVWVAFGILGLNTLWLNHYLPPWGVVVFFALPTVPTALVWVLGTWMRSRRAG